MLILSCYARNASYSPEKGLETWLSYHHTDAHWDSRDLDDFEYAAHRGHHGLKFSSDIN